MRATNQRVLGNKIRYARIVEDRRAWNTMFGADTDGSYAPNTAINYVALKGLQDPRSTLRHEAIHALRAAGVFTAQE